MKKFLLVTIFFSLLSSPTLGGSHGVFCKRIGLLCPKVDIEELIFRENQFFEKFSNVPYTGRVTGKVSGQIIDGQMDGYWEKYYDSGKLKTVGNFRKFKKEGE